jgi:carboxyl-terminal processing protease
MKKNLLLVCLLLVIITSVAAQNVENISPAAKVYLENALDIMEKKALLKREVDWKKLRRETMEKAAGAQETIDTWDAIRYALSAIGDNHSFLQLNKDLREKESARRKTTNVVAVAKSALSSPFLTRRAPEMFIHKSDNCTIPRLIVPMYASQQGDEFATTLNKFIAEADAQNPCGWIVDLRGNNGGNVFPMIAGIGALLDEGKLYYSVDAEGGKTFYLYKNGASGLIEPDGKELIITKIEGTAYRVKKQLPVAILIDKGTASSGEGIAIAFRGREKTRFFGTHTYGVSTSNEGFLLSDGANIVLTTGVCVDKNGKIYMKGIEPDETVSTPDKIPSIDDDLAIRSALDWFRGMAKDN